MYYVYEWFVIETDEIFYVGKGTGRRFKVRKHNKFFNDFIKRQECDSRIIKEFEKEKDAFSYEHERIAELKAIGQCVCNIYEGGAGGTTSWWKKERRNEYSTKNVMKSETQRQRMKTQNPMKDKKVSKAVARAKSRPVVIGGEEYASVKSAMERYGVPHDTIKRWCQKGINSHGELCRYKDEPQIQPSMGRYNRGGCRAIIYDGKRYESAIDVARMLNVSNSSVFHWAQKGFAPDGIQCRYEDETRELTFEKHNSGWKNKKPIIVNGIWYESKAAAEKALGFKPGYLTPYLNGTRKNTKYICKYDNQQPSRENSDKSIPEGSTTNR